MLLPVLLGDSEQCFEATVIGVAVLRWQYNGKELLLFVLVDGHGHKIQPWSGWVKVVAPQ